VRHPTKGPGIAVQDKMKVIKLFNAKSGQEFVYSRSNGI